MKTYQDLQSAGDVKAFIMQAIAEHRGSRMYKIAADAELYDRKQNVTILAYQKLLYTLSGQAVPDNYSANFKIVSGFFNRFITQLNQYLLGNGVILKSKKRLGADFDAKLQQIGRAALVQGVAFGLWNLDKLEIFKLTEFAPLYDEENGALMAGIRFWQIDGDKPLRATLYEIDGYTDFIKRDKKGLEILNPKRTYRQIVKRSVMDGVQIFNGGNYPGFPIVPLWGNPQHQSELIGLREGIDAYDLIKSGFANDLDDASMIFWTLENVGGMDDIDLAKFVERMKTVKAAVVDADGAKAEAHTIDVPYAAREAMLERIQKDLYRDAQVLDVDVISASAKTATEIRAAYQPMDNKVDQYEYCVLQFLSELFKIVGVNDEPKFTRSRIVNQMEETQMILMAAQYLDDETLLNKLPWLTPEEVKLIIERRDDSEMKRFGGTNDENLV